MSEWLTLSTNSGTRDVVLSISATSNSGLYTRSQKYKIQTTNGNKQENLLISQYGTLQFDEPPEYITTYYYTETANETINVCSVSAQTSRVQYALDNYYYRLYRFRVDGGNWTTANNDMSSSGYGIRIKNGKFQFSNPGYHKIEWIIARSERTTPTNNPYTYTPETIVDYMLPDISFQGSSSIAILFPDSVEYIGYHACRDTNVEYIYYPKQLTVLGYGAFANTKITDAYLFSAATTPVPSSYSYPAGVYQSCNNLLRAHIEDGVTEIPKYCFFGCYSLKLTNVEFKNSITTISELAFAYSQGDPFNPTGVSIHELVLPSNLQTIGAYAFRLVKIDQLVIPDSLEYIGIQAFRECDLTEITMDPYNSKLSTIVVDAFYSNQLNYFVFPRCYGELAFGGILDYMATDGGIYPTELYFYMPDITGYETVTGTFPRAGTSGVIHYPIGADYSLMFENRTVEYNGHTYNYIYNQDWTAIADL